MKVETRNNIALLILVLAVCAGLGFFFLTSTEYIGRDGIVYEVCTGPRNTIVHLIKSGVLIQG